MTREEYLADRTAIPPEPKEVGTKEVKVYCTVITYLDVPADLENYSDMKEWIEVITIYTIIYQKNIFLMM